MTMNQVDNQREFTRMDVKVMTELRSASNVRLVGESSDISLNGFFLSCDTTLPVGTDCEIVLILDPESEKGSLKVLGKVIRVKPNGMAIQFSENLSEDHVSQLVALWNPGVKVIGDER